MQVHAPGDADAYGKTNQLSMPAEPTAASVYPQVSGEESRQYTTLTSSKPPTIDHSAYYNPLSPNANRSGTCFFESYSAQSLSTLISFLGGWIWKAKCGILDV